MEAKVKILDTDKLTSYVKSKDGDIVEAKLRLGKDGGIYATHFLYYDGNDVLHDEGIDGEEREVLISVFKKEYEGAHWVIGD